MADNREAGRHEDGSTALSAATGAVTADTTTNISLTEQDWVRTEDGETRPATRQDMLRVLSNIEVSSVLGLGNVL